MRTSKLSPAKPAPAPAAMSRSNYFIPKRMKEQLNELAEKQDVPAAELVRKAIGTMLKRAGYQL